MVTGFNVHFLSGVARYGRSGVLGLARGRVTRAKANKPLYSKYRLVVIFLGMIGE